MSNPIVEAEGLVKHFGKVEALAGLDLVAEAGTVTAVLGPNGAGKTTLIRSIATLLRPEAGSLRVAGIDVVRHPERALRLIGLAGQFAAVEPTMTGRENVRMIARLFGQSRQQSRSQHGHGPHAAGARRGRRPSGPDLLRWSPAQAGSRRQSCGRTPTASA